MRVTPLLCGAVALLSTGAIAGQKSGNKTPAAASASETIAAAIQPAHPYCAGEYADDFSALSPTVRAYEQQKVATSASYCLRTTATYECLSYGSDGSVKRTRKKVVAHGTAFGFRRQGGETLLMTNEHVADWPAVSSSDTPVDGVPDGCKRISDSLRIVDNEADAYERDDISLAKVVSDVSMDIAIVKAQKPLEILPWKVGRSAALKERNVVDVRGFPLGAFRATNLGKVISAYTHDDERDWDHDDFVIDALLSPGNSGSPVLAISCKTGEYELVGVYHAGYIRGSALNVVVGIDQLRDLMTTLKKSPKAHHSLSQDVPDEQDRARLITELASFSEPFFSFGQITAAVRARSDGALIYEVFSHDFPNRPFPQLVLEDLPGHDANTFGEGGRVWFGSAYGLKAASHEQLDADTQAQLNRMLDGLRRASVATFDWHAASREPVTTRERFELVARMERAMKRINSDRSELSQAVGDLADHFGPKNGEATVALVEALTPPPAVTLPAPTVKPAISRSP